MKYLLNKSFTREFPLTHVQMWGRRYVNDFLGEKLPTLPVYVFFYHDGLVTAYRNQPGQTNMVHNIIKSKVGADPNFIRHLAEEKTPKLKELIRLKNRPSLSKKDLIFFLDRLFDCWQLHYIAQFIPLDKKRFSKKDRDRAFALRKIEDAITSELWMAITPFLKRIYPKLGDLVTYLTWDEVKQEKPPAVATLKLRKKRGVWMFNDKIVTQNSLEKLKKEYDFGLGESSDETAGKISGEVAYRGFARGKVKKILTARDVKFFKRNEILVSYMTMPSFIPAMRKAAAVITDEGGITCHAAIFAREFKIPCVTGTKYATKILKDGDEVEVDAVKGVVRVLHRNSKE